MLPGYTIAERSRSFVLRADGIVRILVDRHGDPGVVRLVTLTLPASPQCVVAIDPEIAEIGPAQLYRYAVASPGQVLTLPLLHDQQIALAALAGTAVVGCFISYWRLATGAP